MFLHQRQYTVDVLERAAMAECKPCTTPVDTQGKVFVVAPPVADPIGYRSIAGALQCLIFTRPDITYVVQQICLHMHDPREPQLTTMKRIMRLSRHVPVHLGLCRVPRDNLVSWSSKRQPIVSRSSAEAEYRVVANDVDEAA
eukprot:XP_020397501.1 uncharacterized protein LOC109941329 [Zea mays]